MALGFEGYRAFSPGWEPPDTLTPDQVERCRAALRDPDAWALAAYAGEDPVGHCIWLPAREGNRDDGAPVAGMAHLRQLFVLEPWWGSGVARTLHDRALAAMVERGWERARLLTPAAHARARRFYERAGWVAVWEGPDPKGLGFDVTEYRLELG